MKKYDSYKDSGIEWIGEIPSHWEVKKLKHLSYIKTGYTPSKDDKENYDEAGVVWAKPDDLKEYLPIIDSKERISEIGLKKQNLIPKYSILVCCIGSVGKFGIAGCDLVTNQQINSIVFNESTNTQFGKYLIGASIIEHDRNSNGNVVKILNSENQKNIFFPLPPPLEEQNSIASFLDRKTAEIDELIADKKRLLELYEEEKTAIINQAVTKGLDPNAPMKDSGIEWLGEIPEHWEVKRLKYVASINDEVLTEKTEEDFEIEYVEISGVKSGIGIVETSTYRFKEAPSRARRIVRDGDVLVSTVRTYLKSIAKVDNPPENLIASTGFAVVRPNNINSDYTGFLFYSEPLIGEIISLSTGVSYPAINASQIGDIKIPIPPNNEQIGIAEFIENYVFNLNKQKEKTEKLIELLTEYRTALISEVVTGKIKVTE